MKFFGKKSNYMFLTSNSQFIERIISMRILTPMQRMQFQMKNAMSPFGINNVQDNFNTQRHETIDNHVRDTISSNSYAGINHDKQYKCGMGIFQNGAVLGSREYDNPVVEHDYQEPRNTMPEQPLIQNDFMDDIMQSTDYEPMDDEFFQVLMNHTIANTDDF